MRTADRQDLGQDLGSGGEQETQREGKGEHPVSGARGLNRPFWGAERRARPIPTASAQWMREYLDWEKALPPQILRDGDAPFQDL